MIIQKNISILKTYFKLPKICKGYIFTNKILKVLFSNDPSVLIGENDCEY